MDARLNERLEACHRVVAQHIAVVAGRVALVLVRLLRIHKSSFLGAEVAPEFKLGNRRRK